MFDEGDRRRRDPNVKLRREVQVLLDDHTFLATLEEIHGQRISAWIRRAILMRIAAIYASRVTLMTTGDADEIRAMSIMVSDETQFFDDPEFTKKLRDLCKRCGVLEDDTDSHGQRSAGQ